MQCLLALYKETCLNPAKTLIRLRVYKKEKLKKRKKDKKRKTDSPMLPIFCYLLSFVRLQSSEKYMKN